MSELPVNTLDSLLVFGNPQDQAVRLLGKLGYDVVMPSDRTTLPTFLDRNQFDLIILDGRLEENGVDLCEFLAQHLQQRKVPILYLTEKKEIAQQLADMKAGTVATVELPCSPGKLATRVATALRLRKLAGSANDQASLAEMNAALRDLTKRLAHEREEARGIQEGLLPAELPQDPRCEIACTYLPLEEVGGDWYFVQKGKDGRISVQIADVTGHGLAAAFICSMTKLALFAADVREPELLLEKMNSLMAPQLPAGRFVTMGSVIYDPETGKLRSARAGHPPTLVLHRKTDQVERLMGDGFALGFFEEGTYTATETTLEVGDLALLYTDGVSEAQNRGFDTFGLDRLAAALRASPPEAKTSEVISAVIDAFDEFRDGRLLKDDVTIVALRRTA